MTTSDVMSGVLAPVVTPFKADLSADTERLITHCKWLLSQDCGLAVFGTNSEANSLTMDERFELLDSLVDAGLDPARMMPGELPERDDVSYFAVHPAHPPVFNDEESEEA